MRRVPAALVVGALLLLASPPQRAAADEEEGSGGEAPKAEDGARKGEDGAGAKGGDPIWALLADQAPSRAGHQAEPGELGSELQAPEGPPELETTIGGALRFNLFYKSWDRPATVRSSGNDVAFDTFRIDVESSYGPLSLSAEYRFYAGYNMLHHGWVGYQVLDVAVLKLGVIRVPFGLLPYASHNYFFDLGFYVGLEDDYDLGGRVDFDLGILDVQLAYFRNDEGSYSGTSLDSARYSYDVVRTDAAELGALAPDGVRGSEEVNQLNARVTVTGDHGSLGSTEVGLSGQYGQLRNRLLDDETGYHWAAAAHLHGRYGPIDLMLQGARYGYEPATPPGTDERWMALGAFDAPYRIASEAYLVVANLGYRFDVDWGPLESLTVYEDYSRLIKIEEGYADTQQSTTGVLLHAGPVYTYIDVVLGKHHPWIGAAYESALAEGSPSGPWHTRVNANLGYYF